MTQQKVLTLNTGYQPRPERDAGEVARKIQEQALQAKAQCGQLIYRAASIYDALQDIEALVKGEGGQR